MSYEIYLSKPPCPTCGCCGPEPECPDPTYNLTPIFDLALTGEPLPNPDVGECEAVLFGTPTDRPRGLRVLNGRRAADTVEQLRMALVQLHDPGKHAAFRKLEPYNGWGTLKDAVLVLKRLLELASNPEYQDHVWDVR